MEIVYILRCADGSLYTGYTNDLEKRWNAHVLGRGARYTRSHPPVAIAAAWQTETKSDALRLEYRIKRLTREQKEDLLTEGLPEEAAVRIR